MSAEVAGLAEGVFTVRFSGMLTHPELEAVQEAAADAISKTGKIRILCLAEDFSGWEKGGNWGDVSFQGQYDPLIEKIAIVGDKKWEDLTLLFTSKGIRRMPIEFFSPNEVLKARAWLAAASKERV